MWKECKKSLHLFLNCPKNWKALNIVLSILPHIWEIPLRVIVFCINTCRNASFVAMLWNKDYCFHEDGNRWLSFPIFKHSILDHCSHSTYDIILRFGFFLVLQACSCELKIFIMRMSWSWILSWHSS